MNTKQLEEIRQRWSVLDQDVIDDPEELLMDIYDIPALLAHVDELREALEAALSFMAQEVCDCDNEICKDQRETVAAMQKALGLEE